MPNRLPPNSRHPIVIQEGPFKRNSRGYAEQDAYCMKHKGDDAENYQPRQSGFVQPAHFDTCSLYSRRDFLRHNHHGSAEKDVCLTREMSFGYVFGIQRLLLSHVSSMTNEDRGC